MDWNRRGKLTISDYLLSTAFASVAGKEIKCITRMALGTVQIKEICCLPVSFMTGVDFIVSVRQDIRLVDSKWFRLKIDGLANTSGNFSFIMHKV